MAVVNAAGLAFEIDNYNTHCTNDQTTRIDIAGTINITSPLPPINNPTGAVLEISGALADGVLDGVNRSSILKIDQGVVVIDGLMLVNGKASGAQNAGGAVYILEGQLTIINSLFDGNSADFQGGAILNQRNGKLNILNTTFLRNQAPSWGGALVSYGELNVEGSTFIENESGGGGAIYGALHVVDHQQKISRGFVVSSSTFTANLASYGSALYLYTRSATIEQTTITGNIASGGYIQGAIFTFVRRGRDVIFLQNSIVAGNVNGDCDGDRIFIALGANFDSDGSCVLHGGGGAFRRVSLEALNLSPLGYYGGKTASHVLQRPSNALDTAAPRSLCGEIDQRGFLRPHGFGCDSGSTELGAVDPFGHFPVGDINGNGQIDLLDGRHCIEIAAGTNLIPLPLPSDYVATLNPPTYFPACDINNDGVIDSTDLEVIGNGLIGDGPPNGWRPDPPVTASSSDQQSPPMGLGVLFALTAIGIIMRWRWKRVNHLVLLLAMGLAVSSCGLFPPGTPALYAIVSDNFITISVQNMPGGGLGSLVATNGGFGYDPNAIQIKSIQPVGEFTLMASQIFNDVGEARFVAVNGSGAVVNGAVLIMNIKTGPSYTDASIRDGVMWRPGQLELGDSMNMPIGPGDYQVFP